jgi:hypothetical protein
MVLVEDKFYYETLDVLRGRIELSPVFRELKAFIQSQYEVTVYNLVFREIKYGILKRQWNLCILLASTGDFRKMRMGLNYIESIQKEIAEKFHELARIHNFGKIKSGQDIFVSYVDFSSEMKTDANWKTMETASKIIADKYASHNVWGVHAAFESSVVFFLSKEKKKKCTTIKSDIEDDYFGILKQHDEFNLFNRSSFSLRFDSKQNLDDNYEGNLFYYFR